MRKISHLFVWTAGTTSLTFHGHSMALQGIAFIGVRDSIRAANYRTRGLIIYNQLFISLNICQPWFSWSPGHKHLSFYNKVQVNLKKYKYCNSTNLFGARAFRIALHKCPKTLCLACALISYPIFATNPTQIVIAITWLLKWYSKWWLKDTSNQASFLKIVQILLNIYLSVIVYL